MDLSRKMAVRDLKCYNCNFIKHTFKAMHVIATTCPSSQRVVVSNKPNYPPSVSSQIAPHSATYLVSQPNVYLLRLPPVGSNVRGA